MRKTKAKQRFWQDRKLPFVIVWALGIGTVGVVSRLWQVAPLPFLYNEPEARVTLSLLTSMIGTGLVQVFLVERLLKKPMCGKPMRGWKLYTVTSAVIAAFLNQVTPSLFLTYILPRIPNFDLFDLVISLALNAPASLLQAFWLHKHVKRA